MAYRSGIGAQLGVAEEITWGTRVAPARFFEFNKESMKNNIESLTSKAIRAGSRMQRTDRQVNSPKGVGGDLELEVGSKNFGLWFKHMLGASATTTPAGGTLTRDHTATLADPYGLGLSVQVGRPDTSGTVNPFDYAGCKITGWELSNSVDEFLMLKLTLDGKSEDTSQSLAAASFPASQELLHWDQGAINIGGSAVATVRSIAIKGEMGQKTDRFFIQSGFTKGQPIANQFSVVTVEMECDFESLVAYNRFVNRTLAQVDATWTAAAVIEGALYPRVVVTLNNCRFSGETPNVDGPDVLGQKLTAECLFDGTNGPISIAYRTSDTTP